MGRIYTLGLERQLYVMVDTLQKHTGLKKLRCEGSE